MSSYNMNENLIEEMIRFYNPEFESWESFGGMASIIVHPGFLGYMECGYKEALGNLPNKIVLVNGPDVKSKKIKFDPNYPRKIRNKIEKVLKAPISYEIVLPTTELDPSELIYSNDVSLRKIETKSFLTYLKERGIEKFVLAGEIYYKQKPFDPNGYGCVNVVGGLMNELGMKFVVGPTKP